MIHYKELWIHRIAIIVLLIGMVVLIQGNKQAQYMGLNNIRLIEKQGEQITEIIKSDLATTIIQNGMAEDYPSKKKLGDREWCKDRSCLIGTGIE